MQTAKNPSVSARQAAHLSGLSLSMLNYLCRTEILPPSGGNRRGRGRKRLYTFSDVLFLRVTAALLDRGIEVRRLSKALQAARADATNWLDIRRKPSAYLITDGTEVFVAKRGRLESKTSDRQYAFAFVLDIASHHGALTANWPNARAA